MAKHHTALVKTARGYRTLIVDSVNNNINSFGSMVKARARRLKPVIAFQKRTLFLKSPRVKY